MEHTANFQPRIDVAAYRRPVNPLTKRTDREALENDWANIRHDWDRTLRRLGKKTHR